MRAPFLDRLLQMDLGKNRFERERITKKTLHPPGAEDALAFVLDNVFTQEECQEWIVMTEERGYKKALVNVGGGRELYLPDVRNSDRCIIDSVPMVTKLFDRIKPFLPPHCK